MGTAPPGSGSGKARGLRRRQGTVGFKLKIPARPQLSRQGPRPRVRRASPGPFDFRRPVPLGDASRLGGGLRPRPSPPRLGLRVPRHLPGPERAGARRRGQLWPSRPPPCVPGGSGEGRGRGGAGHSPPSPAQSPRGPAAGAALGQCHPAGLGKDAPGSARSAEAPGARPQRPGAQSQTPRREEGSRPRGLPIFTPGPAPGVAHSRPGATRISGPLPASAGVSSLGMTQSCLSPGESWIGEGVPLASRFGGEGSGAGRSCPLKSRGGANGRALLPEARNPRRK